MTQNREAETLCLSLLLSFLLFWICQSLSLMRSELSLITVSINAVYVSVIIVMIFNLGALKTVMEGNDLEAWLKDEGIELVFFSILILIMMSLASYSLMLRDYPFLSLLCNNFRKDRAGPTLATRLIACLLHRFFQS